MALQQKKRGGDTDRQVVAISAADLISSGCEGVLQTGQDAQEQRNRTCLFFSLEKMRLRGEHEHARLL